MTCPRKDDQQLEGNFTGVRTDCKRDAYHRIRLINDDESGLHNDYERWLERLAPHEPVSQYLHNRTGDGASGSWSRLSASEAMGPLANSFSGDGANITRYPYMHGQNPSRKNDYIVLTKDLAGATSLPGPFYGK